MRRHRSAIVRALSEELVPDTVHPSIVQFAKRNGFDLVDVQDRIDRICEDAKARGADVHPMDAFSELRKMAAMVGCAEEARREKGIG